MLATARTRAARPLSIVSVLSAIPNRVNPRLATALVATATLAGALAGLWDGP